MKKKRYKREQRKYDFGNSIEVERLYRGKGGARGQPREKRTKPTPEQIEKQNKANREKHLRRIIKENFKEDDYWITLTYKRGLRMNKKEAEEDFCKFCRILRREYRKKGYELKWVRKTEVGKRGAAHHHFLVNRIPDGDVLIKRCWQKIAGAGHPNFKHTYEEGGFQKLTEYILKEDGEKKEGETGNKKQGGLNYSRSRNLVIPEPEITRAKAKEMREYPVAEEGYYIDPDSVSMGVNPYTGQEYQHFTMYRLKEPERRKRKEGGQGERGEPVHTPYG